jgi:hypothetical protein
MSPTTYQTHHQFKRWRDKIKDVILSFVSTSARIVVEITEVLTQFDLPDHGMKS